MPSIAVLPFQNRSGDAEQEYFADGIAEDIITALSRFNWFFVIARNSSFSYKGTSPDIRRVAQELGVQYVLEGSVRKAGPTPASGPRSQPRRAVKSPIWLTRPMGIEPVQVTPHRSLRCPKGRFRQTVSV